MYTAKQPGNKNLHEGSDLDDFLHEEGIFEEVESAALKRTVAMKLADIMEKERVKKTTMAKRMLSQMPSIFS
jgi:hypothetical protein